MSAPEFCPMCDCDELVLLGTLGACTYFTCRDCGAEIHTEADCGIGDNDE